MGRVYRLALVHHNRVRLFALGCALGSLALFGCATTYERNRHGDTRVTIVPDSETSAAIAEGVTEAAMEWFTGWLGGWQ